MCKNLSIKRLGVIITLLVATIAAILYYALLHHSPTRYAVLAGYNADGTIHPYVITYLKGLNEVADGVVYIADSPLKEGEEKKLQGLVLHTEHNRHEEYDWGSYKRGFNWLKTHGYLDKADELIFANDSCYAPMQSFKPMFEDMRRRKEVDFWGNSPNVKFTPHIQSYFIVLRQPVIRSKALAAFLNNITHQEHYEQYITQYELQLTPMLKNLGYKWDSWLPYQQLLPTFDENYPDVNNYPLRMLRDHNNQFLKRRTFGTMLAILDDRADLLRYIKQRYPQRYNDIAAEISPSFIPDDLKENN